MSFWTGSKQSVLQDVVADGIKAAFKGLVVGVLVLLVMEYAKGVMERNDKRKALAKLQNAAVETAILSLTDFHGERVDCVRSTTGYKTEACNTALKDFDLLVRRTRLNLHGVLGSEISSLSTLEGAIDSLNGLRATGNYSSKLRREQVAAMDEAFRNSISSIATEIK